MPDVCTGKQEFAKAPVLSPGATAGQRGKFLAEETSGALRIRASMLEPYQMLNERETASVLCCSVSKLQKDRVRGCGLKFVRVGRSIRYCTKDIAAFIEASTRQSTAEK